MKMGSTYLVSNCDEAVFLIINLVVLSLYYSLNLSANSKNLVPQCSGSTQRKQKWWLSVFGENVTTSIPQLEANTLLGREITLTEFIHFHLFWLLGNAKSGSILIIFLRFNFRQIEPSDQLPHGCVLLFDWNLIIYLFIFLGFRCW